MRDTSGNVSPAKVCTAKISNLYPHAFAHDAGVAADASVTPGYDTCGMTEAEHADCTPERIRVANFYEARYRRAVENTAGHLGGDCFAQADRELIDEAHDEALAEQAKRDAARVIAASRAPEGERCGCHTPARLIASHGLPPVPASVDDRDAWAEYIDALPAPTDAEIADVLAEYGDPYAAARAEAVEGFKLAARAIWTIRTAGHTDQLHTDLIANLRSQMRTFRGVIELYGQLTESWRLATRTDRDGYTVRWHDFGTSYQR